MIGEAALRANLEHLLRRMAEAAGRANRAAESVRLIAVTKGQPAEVVRLAHAAGVRDVGENRVEEALAKQAALADLADLRWHLIGHLQSRKAGDVPGAFVLVHSIDRPKIARALDTRAGERGLRVPALLECNVSGEASKDGWDARPGADRAVLVEGLRAAAGLANLDVSGLMTMAPWRRDPSELRSVFRRLRQLRDECAAGGDRWPELSMGMTDDFELAIEEGATMVRIGRALFGERPD
ncbi:MAG: YggS family pyridoxal phosphate-dependent enzyme [Chloroflexi bacterium]|nr:YggS family pyridoxal phosphate-dependent enzyme [Chloroflexota bacterium]